MAGASPKGTAVAMATAAENARMFRSGARSRMSGLPPIDIMFTSAPAAIGASNTPHVLPASARIALSTSSCRTIRARPAPMARRTAISLRRALPRASIRPATLVHAMSSTNATIPMSSCSGFAYISRR